MARERHLLSTRIDAASAERRRALAEKMELSLVEMNVTMMQQYLKAKPWTKGEKFVSPAAYRLTGEPGWADCKIELPAGLLETVRATAKKLKVPAAAFGYSSVLWWLKNAES